MNTSNQKLIFTVLLFLLKRELDRCNINQRAEVKLHIGGVENEKKKLDRTWDEGNEMLPESRSSLMAKPEKPILAESRVKS